MDSEQKIEFISVDKLQFDPENPRLSYAINSNDEQAIIRWMLEDATIIDLMASIGEHGYFPGEPLLVVPTLTNNGKYIVIEGNRRLAAIKLLHNPELAPVRKISIQNISQDIKCNLEDIKKLPVLIFATAKDILNYLGYRHITGIKEWEPLAKARYLQRLFDNSTESDMQTKLRALSKTVGSGSRSDYVARLLTCLAVYDQIAENAFFGIKNLNESQIKFSVLTTALNYSNIVKFLGLTNAQSLQLNGLQVPKLQELTSWLFEEYAEGKTRLGESRKLKELSAVVNHKVALKAFREGESLQRAYMLTEAPTNIFRNALMEARIQLETARNHLIKVDVPSDTDDDILKEIQKMARDLRLLVTQRLLDTEDL